ncbi:Phage protein U [Serratia quinivorans]|jgi:phage protein U|uniref:phage tail protein n=1 Tax=Serratia TaxID=613 RepID=UPI000D851128|nr:MULTISPECIES: phage tail protein [Serratia]MBV6694687.1 phage tail protein [Serratia quinivorans]MCS4266894.1 phage protein U [Serratia sp. BIGb0163]CAI1078458.1 Phage protein U [Serratia quinivorans]CAI1134014.1 Phage protein U [Serratia quinivorans]CAI1912812.1 Phage protein U [Serratia quinivorans]
MMLTLGMFVFMLKTVPYQSMQRSSSFRWPTNARIGQRPSAQFLGADSEKITLTGVLMPEVTGGALSLMTLQLMASQGRAWPLIEGSGTIYGMYVIENIAETKTQLFSNGSARQIEFTINLMRVDESLISMFGDLRQQALDLADKAGQGVQRIGGLLS